MSRYTGDEIIENKINERMKRYQDLRILDENKKWETMWQIREAVRLRLTQEQIDFMIKPQFDYYVRSDILQGFVDRLSMEEVEFMTRFSNYNDRHKILEAFRSLYSLEEVKELFKTTNK